MRTYKTLIARILTLAFICFSVVLSAQEADVAAGKALFKNQCASCHNKNMKDDLTGPALGPAEANWADYPQEDLYNWIKNSQAMIAAGHPRATELWNTWKPTVMTSFPTLTDADIANVLAYIEFEYTKAPVVNGGGDAGAVGVAQESDNTMLFAILAGVLGLLAIVLARIVSNLNYMSELKAGRDPGARKTLVQTLTSPGVIGFALFLLVVIGGYMTVNNAVSLGRQQGYQPEQPIKFSHATHAGTHKIECQYCHDGARRSKHSVIPAANTCMNCHKAIKKGSKYGTEELTKIYASIGYSPKDDKYIENYESMSREEKKDLYWNWIESNLEVADEAEVERQWNGIVSSLTSELDDNIAGPIEWIKIHNLPDHVYFNHAQHVSVGKVECQTCHGQIQEMEVVAQHSPLSMGWCINCHRQTEVQFANNDYYKSFANYHDEIASGERDKVTVEDIGGLECQKCHY